MTIIMREDLTKDQPQRIQKLSMKEVNINTYYYTIQPN